MHFSTHFNALYFRNECAEQLYDLYVYVVSVGGECTVDALYTAINISVPVRSRSLAVPCETTDWLYLLM